MERSDAVQTLQNHSGLRETEEAGWFSQSPGEQSESRSVLSDSFQPHELCSPWNTGVTFPFSMGSSQPRVRTQVSHIAGGFFTS